jgi:carboxyl-terminal processing protease
MRNIPARHAINATLQRIGENGSERWMFQDVHQGGPAFAAGIRPGDLLLECGGREVRPPNDLTFSVSESANLLIEKLHGEVQKVNVQLPMPKSQKHPVTAPQAVTIERLSDEIGLLRVAMFPGAIGIDVAKDIDHGITALDGCNRLIVDLRGNTGGGIGGLRLMSYLTPGKLEVGYSLTRITEGKRTCCDARTNRKDEMLVTLNHSCLPLQEGGSCLKLLRPIAPVARE